MDVMGASWKVTNIAIQSLTFEYGMNSENVLKALVSILSRRIPRVILVPNITPTYFN
jgi:hypothetical protein